MRKTSEAQRNADKRWREKNREYANYLRNRASARCFIRNKATLEDLKELEKLIKEKSKEMQRGGNVHLSNIISNQ
ncbi:MAG: hypothetical protein E6248_13240 [Clostridium sp.]|uniref:hypothetical protein n=1 Tax=Clostridium sp. TaxID=1506 RepID=UPI00290B50CD|nr:hypothetical protein [Clostridium sp.]MDU5111404.1 hypothetical protein [Clostridium sp.]